MRKKTYVFIGVTLFLFVSGLIVYLCSEIDKRSLINDPIDEELRDVLIIGSDFEKAQKLIDRGANVNIKTGQLGYSFTPLMESATPNYPKVVEFLVKNGININAISNDFILSWYYAKFVQNTFNAMSFNVGYNPNLANVRVLVENGIDLNWQDKTGQTALMSAAIWNHKDIVKYLIEKGADINIKDKSGKTALDHAKILDNKESIEILQQESKKLTATKRATGHQTGKNWSRAGNL